MTVLVENISLPVFRISSCTCFAELFFSFLLAHLILVTYLLCVCVCVYLQSVLQSILIKGSM